MFHVHHDQRTQRSANKIAKALNELVQQKDFQQITIADLQRQTGIARTTFYRSFDNLVDVLEWECAQQFNEMIKKYDDLAHFPSERQLLHDYLEHWMRNGELLTIIMKIQRIDIIYHYQYNFAHQMVEKYGSVDELQETPLSYFLAVRTGFILSIIFAWVQSGKKETLPQLQKIVEK
ncbi:MAG: hypothetical protein ACI4TY_05960, partial [Candidatus Limosilactobacillus intestinavium]